MLRFAAMTSSTTNFSVTAALGRASDFSSGVAFTAAVLILSVSSGCLERRVIVESEPSGASVVLNDVEVGRTPLEADFTYYGIYDVQVNHDGYEPLRTTATASAPLWEYPPIDLLSTALPFTLRRRQNWNFVLTPSLERTQTPGDLAEGAIARAKALREQLLPVAQP